MSRAIRIAETGGPDVLQLAEAPASDPGPGEVRLQQSAIGVNFIDIYHRTGLYPTTLPTGLGLEAAGMVEAVGPGVDHLAPGDRVAYFLGPLGAYGERRTLPADTVVRLPEGLDAETAAAVMLKGCTVEYLLQRVFHVKPSHRVLLHAAAGGVGLLAVQWLRSIGATVIGTAGTPDKAEKARRAGCDHVIGYREENVAKRVREITDGAGVDVVYDGVGQATFQASLDSLAPRGMLVSYGNASGPVTGVDLGVFQQKGSLFFTRPTLMDYYADPGEFAAGVQALFARLLAGDMTVEITQRYPLDEVSEAHRALEARETTGSIILVA